MPCKLIVNADDLGWAVGRDRGIFRCIDQGIVTSVSLLANGATFQSAVEALSGCRVGVGAHLNLSEGQSLTGPLRGLTDDGGLFVGKERSRQVFAAQRFDPIAVFGELVAQVNKILDAGITIDHVDSHQHMFLFPAMTPLLVTLCQQFQIKAVRHILPAEPECDDPDGSLGDELKLYRRHAPLFSQTIADGDLSCPDGLWGMPLLNRLEESSLLSLIDCLPCGCYELMVHPGDEDNGLPFSGPERVHEMQALISTVVRQRIEERGIQLATFGAVPCVS